MTKEIMIDPVTRIEGHAKITIQLDDAGDVSDAHFHVTQVRGFEKFSEGRPFQEMPALMARICGICPVSHLVASAKACDTLMAVEVPEVAADLRRVINLGQIVQSHALSFFHLSSPDLLLGMDADPAKRHIFGVAEANMQIAQDGIWLRKFGQQVIERLGGKRVHPGWIVAGGLAEPLKVELRDAILADIPEALQRLQRTLAWFKPVQETFREEMRAFANFPTLFMGLVSKTGGLEHYDGKVRIVDAAGKIVGDNLEPADYATYIGEKVENYSYLKSAYYKPMGYPDGIYRVGPLARLNIIDHVGTPLAEREWVEFRELQRGVPLSSFYYHYARLIELLFGIEKIQQILESPKILDKRVRAFAGPNRSEGVGMSEAPRGTLLHHYKIDESGLMTWSNLIIATANNNMAMDRGVLQTAKQFIQGGKVTDGALNRVEAVIRTFDPCLSCSTHAVGQMPMVVDVLGADGRLIERTTRN
ncbi:MAG: Ni/Fe hydrogenase subunit alpha [Anaerolineales bacterium]|nr:Ni/Fe hydrogenase subunit alpha [Anaerolineales bacterium]